MYLDVLHDVFLGEIILSGLSAKSSISRNASRVPADVSSQKNRSRQIPPSSKKARSAGVVVRPSAAFATANL
jgi:hypothetical protein